MDISTKSLKEKVDQILQQEISTKDRPTGFRIFVGLIIAVNVFFIIFCLVR